MNHWKMSPPGGGGGGLSRGFTVLTIGALEHPWPTHRRFLFFFWKSTNTRAKLENEGGMRERKRKTIFSFHLPQPPIWKWETLACVAGDLFGEREKQGVKRARTRRWSLPSPHSPPFFFLPSAINACKALFNLTCYHPSGQGTSPALRTRWWVIFGAVLSQQLGLGNSEKTLTRGWHKGGGPQDCLFSRKNARIRRKVVGQE